VEIRFHNESDRTVTVYDPLINGLLWKHSVKLAVLDSEGNYRGDLLQRTGGSVVSTSKKDWVHIPPGGLLASRREISHGQFYDEQLNMQQLDAHDSLEVRIYAHTVAGRPSDFIAVEREGLRRSFARFRELYQDKFSDSEFRIPDDPEEAADRENPLTYREWQATFPGKEVGVSNRISVAALLEALRDPRK
jgi:hypothetical protein